MPFVNKYYIGNNEILILNIKLFFTTSKHLKGTDSMHSVQLPI